MSVDGVDSEANLSKSQENSPELQDGSNINETIDDDIQFTTIENDNDIFDDQIKITIVDSDPILVESNEDDELDKIMEERMAILEKNLFLNVKMVEHFNKKEINFDITVDEDIESQYKEKLFEYEKIVEKGEDELRMMEEKLKEAASFKQSHLEECSNRIKKVKKHLKNTAKNLFYAYSEKPLHDKTIDQLILKLDNKMNEVSKVRLPYLHTKKLLISDKEKLDSYNALGSGINESDYEKLLIENQKMVSKSDEYDKEIENFTELNLHLNQKLANIEHKLLFLTSKCEKEDAQLEELNVELNKARMELFEKKEERNKLRNMVDHQQDNNMLVNKELLEDYQMSLCLIKDLRLEHEEFKKQISVKKLEMNKKTPIDKKEDKAEQPRIKPRFHHSAPLRPSIDLQY